MRAAVQSRRNVTDRAHRYRAQRNAPADPKQCAFCGTKSGQIDVEHINGKEEDSTPDNLIWACRSCNVTKANVMRKRGMGRLTHQYNPAGGAKTLKQWLTAVSVVTPHQDRGQGSLFPLSDNNMAVADAVALIRATPASRRSSFARQIGSRKAERSRYNPSLGSMAASAASYLTGVGLSARVADGIARLNPPKKRPGPKRRNPSVGTSEAFREFHGRDPEEVVTVTKRIHHHKHLASAGELKRLEVIAIDGKHLVTVHFKRGTFLAFNEQRNQLFVEGGDQSVNLRDFGIKPKEEHETETLGQVQLIDYFTRKDHLGDEGGEAVYRHKFRTTNEDGKHVTIKIARYPDLIYRVRDEALEFSGGSYKILAEGVDR